MIAGPSANGKQVGASPNTSHVSVAVYGEQRPQGARRGKPHGRELKGTFCNGPPAATPLVPATARVNPAQIRVDGQAGSAQGPRAPSPPPRSLQGLLSAPMTERGHP